MANHGMVVGLDIGTNTVKILVADVRNQQVNVIAVGRSVSHGVKRGIVVDIDAVAQDIRTALTQVEEQTNQKFHEVIASIPATAIKMRHLHGSVAVKDSQHISYHDVNTVVRAATKIPLEHDQAILDITDSEFSVDDLQGVLDPNDMVGNHLGFDATAYIGPRLLISNLQAAIERAGLHLHDMVLAPLAMSQTIVSDGEQEFGAILLDLGAGQTTATIVHQHQIRQITTYSAGGTNISKDISTVLGISEKDAETLKLDSGVVAPQFANAKNMLTIQPVGKDEQRISEEELSEIIGARVQQIVNKIGERLDAAGAFSLPGGMIVTGGGASLRNMQDVLQMAYGINVKLFMPREIGLQNPAYVGAWSLVHYAAKQSNVALLIKQSLYGLPLTINQQPIDQQFIEGSQNNARQVKPQTTQSVPDRDYDYDQPVETGPRSQQSWWQRIRNWFSDELFN